MPLPSLFDSYGDSRPWGVPRAAAYGAAIGALAAIVKMLEPAHHAGALVAKLIEIPAAALAFAALFAAGAALRNALVVRF